MSIYILMKIFESTPSRYDRGISILTFGKLDKVYDRLTSHIKKGQKILDIGCGTGALTLRIAKKDADVKGIDVDSQMLEIAQKKLIEANLAANVTLREMGVAELGGEKPKIYDAVTSGLCFSELTKDELLYTLKEVKRILKPGGILLIGDEVRSNNISKKMLNWLIRFPLLIITLLITQTTTHAIHNLPQKIKTSGLVIESVRLNTLESFIEIVARNPQKGEK